jgi:predicted MFS family arabinose efflux permease
VRWERVSFVAVVATIGSILPSFLVGALAVQIKADLGISAGDLGIAIGSYFVGAALLSAAMGRAVERIGPARAMHVATATSAASMVGIAAVADGLGPLVAFLVVAGGAQSLGQPATNLFLAQGTPPNRLGIAFAIKQSGMPAGTLLGGAAVPIIGLTLGWRWAFVGGAALALAAFALVPWEGSRQAATRAAPAIEAPTGARVRPTPLGPLVVLSVAVAFGAAAAGSVVSFYVSGGVAAGLSESVAGWSLTLGSAVGIAMRLWQGRRADARGSRHLPVVAAMLSVGVAGHLLLALTVSWVHVAAIPLAFGAGWAWPGLFNLSVVRNYPAAPGAATGVSQTGTYLGAMLGPIVFGAIVEASGYGAGWLFSAGSSAVAAVMMLAGRQQLLSRRARDGDAAQAATTDQPTVLAM